MTLMEVFNTRERTHIARKDWFLALITLIAEGSDSPVIENVPEVSF